MDLSKEIGGATKTGNVIFGKKKVLRTIQEGKAKLVLSSTGCPYAADLASLAEAFNIPVHITDLDSYRLGAICKRPFAVTAIAVLDPGESRVLDLLK